MRIRILSSDLLIFGLPDSDPLLFFICNNGYIKSEFLWDATRLLACHAPNLSVRRQAFLRSKTRQVRPLRAGLPHLGILTHAR